MHVSWGTSSSKSPGVSGLTNTSGFSKIQPSKADWENFYGDDKVNVKKENELVQHNELTYSSSIDEDLTADDSGVKIEKKKPV